MAKHPTLLQHFRSFAYQNSIKNFDTALEYFSVFGGTGWSVDTTKSIEELIEEKILKNYEPIHSSITRYTHENVVYHRVLSLIAQGVEYEEDAFKKARVGKDRGKDAIDYLEMKSLLKFDLSVKDPKDKSARKSDRVLFNLPFMRFWFAFISPNYQGISSRDYEEFFQKWQQAKGNFHILLSNLLMRELVVQSFSKDIVDDPIVSIGSYYDKSRYIELVATRESGKVLAGACKYSKEPAKANMLETLKSKCKSAELDATEYILFSKNGFIDEVVKSKEKSVKLLSSSNLATLLNDLSKEDLLTYKNKRY